MSKEKEQLLCIDIPGVVVRREPAGWGWQAHVEGDTRQWSRGDTEVQAVGSLIRRLALEHEGANWRRRQKSDSPSKRKWDVLGVAAALNAEYPRVDYHGEILKVVAFVLSAVGVELEESDKVYEFKPPVKEKPWADD